MVQEYIRRTGSWYIGKFVTAFYRLHAMLLLYKSVQSKLSEHCELPCCMLLVGLDLPVGVVAAIRLCNPFGLGNCGRAHEECSLNSL